MLCLDVPEALRTAETLANLNQCPHVIADDNGDLRVYPAPCPAGKRPLEIVQPTLKH